MDGKADETRSGVLQDVYPSLVTASWSVPSGKGLVRPEMDVLAWGVLVV